MKQLNSLIITLEVIQMNNKKTSILKDLTHLYSKKELFKSFLTGFIFFIFPATLLGVLTANIAPLYYYRFIYILIVLYLLLIILSDFTNRIIINTLKNYLDKSPEFNYKKLLLILTITSSTLISLLFLAGLGYAYIRGVL